MVSMRWVNLALGAVDVPRIAQQRLIFAVVQAITRSLHTCAMSPDAEQSESTDHDDLKAPGRNASG